MSQVAITRKQEIISQSARLFRKQGYAATSMRDIAREVQIEAASLYNHISSKGEILSIILIDIAETFTEGMEDIINRNITPLQKLEAIIDQHVDMTIQETDNIALVPSEWIHLEEPNLKKFLLLRKNYEKKFKLILEECIAEGSVQIVDVDVAVFSILSTLRWLYSWYTKKKMKKEILKIELKKTLLHGLVV